MLKHIIKASIVAIATILTFSAVDAYADGSVMFNYQGRVKVRGDAYDGNGQFKFAILSPDKKATLWSNDSTSIDGSEPTTGMQLEVTDGVFNVIMGDTAQMDSINSTIFQNREPLKLRTWFNDGTHGFQELNPEYNLINVNLITSETGGDDFVIYVNGTTGNDAKSGLKPQHAKKTIQAAVDILPSRINANVTIDIADGTYPEEVSLYGITVKPGRALKLKGDEVWSPTNSGVPSVLISAADGSTTGVRRYALSAVDCNNLELFGIGFQNASEAGLQLSKGEYVVRNCFASGNGSNGINFSNQSFSTVYSTASTSNSVHGIGVNTNSRAILNSCVSKYNQNSGLAIFDQSSCPLGVSGDFSNNQLHGILCEIHSNVGASYGYSGTVKNNKGYGIVAAWNSFFTNFLTTNQITGNTQGSQLTFSGGYTNW